LHASVSTPLTAFVPHFIGIVVCFLLVALFSGLEAGLLAINRIWLSEQVSRGNRRAALVQEILRVPSRFISVMLTMETTCSVVLAVLWTVIGDWFIGIQGWPAWVFIPWGALLIILLVTFCEIIPKAYFASTAERTVIALARISYILIRIVYPIAFVLEKIAHGLIRIGTGKSVQIRRTTVTEKDLMSMVSVGEDEGVIEEQEREMIHSIFGFGDLVAREIMVPRVDLISLDVDSSVKEALDTVVKHGHSRIPVFEGSADRIKGLLYAKDLLRHVEKGDLFSIKLADLIRPDVFFVPGTKDLSSLLEEMQAKKAHMAIVMDEYGGTAGLVTIEDILEEIVGEIQDEYDRPLDKLVTRGPDGSLIVDAKLGLHDFDDELGVELPAPEGVETLGGLLYQVLGRVPEIGEIIPVRPILHRDGEYPESASTTSIVQFKVLEVDANRIGRVQVRLIGGKDIESEHELFPAFKSEERPESPPS
jgi:CBS domain containing-hemolysin-like protein